jgi:undecaprenyl-diphosphatase
MTLGENIDKVFYNFDMWVFHFFGTMQNTFLTYVAKFFTTFGDEGFVIPFAVLGIVLCFFKKTRKFGFSIIFAIAIGTIVTNVVVKPMALRIRPYNTLQGNADYWSWYVGAGALSESDYSFPSGHTTAAFELATALFLCFKSEKKKIAYLFPVIALCTAGSRVYLMVHYASDVLGGMIVGIIAGVVAYFLMKLAVLILKKIKLDDKIDVEKLFSKLDESKRNKLGGLVIAVAVVAIFLVGFIPSLSEGGEQICAYDGEYNCYNAARVDDEKYPAIDGKEYCKIHWKQLMGVEE